MQRSGIEIADQSLLQAECTRCPRSLPESRWKFEDCLMICGTLCCSDEFMMDMKDSAEAMIGVIGIWLGISIGGYTQVGSVVLNISCSFKSNVGEVTFDNVSIILVASVDVPVGSSASWTNCIGTFSIVIQAYPD